MLGCRACWRGAAVATRLDYRDVAVQACDVSGLFLASDRVAVSGDWLLSTLTAHEAGPRVTAPRNRSTLLER